MSVDLSRWTPDAVSGLVAAGPGERLAFVPPKTGPARLAEHLAALANAHGGTALLGVAPNGRVMGIAAGDEARGSVQAASLLASPPLILPLPQAVTHQGKTLLLIVVPSGLPHVYSVDGRYLTRTGAQNRLLSAAELGALLLARAEAGFEARPAPSAGLTDLELTLVGAYLAALNVPPGEEWQHILLSRGALMDTTPTGAAPPLPRPPAPPPSSD